MRKVQITAGGWTEFKSPRLSIFSSLYLRKSVDEPMVGDSDSSTDYADYAVEMKPEPTPDADPDNSRHSPSFLSRTRIVHRLELQDPNATEITLNESTQIVLN